LPLKEFIFEPKQGKNQVILKWNNDSNANNKLDSDILTQTITACLIVKVQVSVNEDDSTKLNVSINLLLYNKTNCQKLCFFKGYIRRSEWCLST
jgi:hypothetical protein